jgi:hypothetical protein
MTASLLSYYRRARGVVMGSPHAHEVSWYQSLQPERVTESEFLRETAWVILCSGFSERAVRRVFSYVSLCFCDFESAAYMHLRANACIMTAARRYAHMPKLQAVASAAAFVAQWRDFSEFRRELLRDYDTLLRNIPYIGPITVRHLAKNIGFDVAKRDRHLVRVGERFGYSDVDRMCLDLSVATDSVVEREPTGPANDRAGIRRGRRCHDGAP